MSARGDETRDHVMNTALALFAKQGWAGFTIHTLSAKSRVSVGSLYHHFGSMDGVAVATYSRSMARLLSSLERACAKTKTARGAVETLMAAYLNFTVKRRAEAIFIHASAYASFMPAHAERIAADTQAAMAPLLARMMTHLKSGALVRASPATLEYLLIGPVAEAARRFLANDPNANLAEVRRVLPSRTWLSVSAGV